MKTPSIVLTIAGSDSSGGAGIQADIKTISAMGGFAASAITSITAQNTQGVQAIHPIPTEMVRQQIESVMDDLHPESIKIGMVCDAEIALIIAECIRKYQPRWVVYDPVMVSTSGHKLMTDDTIEVIKKELIPLVTIITPNLHEARILSGENIQGIEAMKASAEKLSERYGCSTLVKGGHLEEGAMCDVLYNKEEKRIFTFTDQKIESKNLHGTGCTLSSAIATQLAQEYPLHEAIARSKAYVTRAIHAAKDMHIGHGYGPLWHFV
jgi:hydroxymethylpyrimidine/phosphomethylpyrimidine kinase